MSTGNVLSSVSVGEAMRRQVVRAGAGETIDRCIARMIKYKTGAVLVEDGGACLGVVSKTDVLGMWYAGIGLETGVGEFAVSEPICCHPTDRLETALAIMLENGIRRVYVREEIGGEIVGVVGYADVVGAMYRFCIRCRQNLYRGGSVGPKSNGWLTAADVMHRGVTGCATSDPLQVALELLLEGGMGAVPVFGNSSRWPDGVLSMTDAVLAYRHEVDLGAPVQTIMSVPVLSCRESDSLSASLRTMVLADVQRLFVCEASRRAVVGVLSLTDAARSRSGACKACGAARL